MRVVVAPDSFGGWKTAAEVATLTARRLQQAGHTVHIRPMSDGGEGFLDALHHGGHLTRRAQVSSCGPLGGPRQGYVGWLSGGQAVIESSTWLRASTLSPWSATSVGLGRVLATHVASKAIIGLGGSSTVDMGVGALSALGVHPVDQHGRLVPASPGALHRIRGFRGDPIDVSSWTVWADVSTRLTRGAVVFGPQKGVSKNALDDLQQQWMTVAHALQQWCHSTGRAPPDLALTGGGAAGGLGFALAAMGAAIQPGVAAMTQLVLGDVDLEADLLVTGEGRLDASSADDKVVHWLSSHCARHGLHFAAIVGQRSDDAPELSGPVFVCGDGPDRDTAFMEAVEALVDHI